MPYALCLVPYAANTERHVGRSLHATAGLRLLPQEDQKAILEAVRGTLFSFFVPSFFHRFLQAILETVRPVLQRSIMALLSLF